MTTRLPYEFKCHSQHHEDGIIAAMTQAVLEPNRFFVEIGWGTGLQNMTRNLMEQGWAGVGVDVASEPDPTLHVPTCVRYLSTWISPKNLAEVFRDVPDDFDFFSLDIDSFDFEIAKWLLAQGFRPKTVCVEFNQKFGPTVLASFPWVSREQHPKRKRVYDKKHFYGSSLEKYRRLWCSHGYRYFGFDTSATNLFFYRPESLESLDHLPCHSEDLLKFQEDIVKTEILNDRFWCRHLDKIYVPG